jgi:hypothetical protein
MTSEIGDGLSAVNAGLRVWTVNAWRWNADAGAMDSNSASRGPSRGVLGALVQPLSLDCEKIEGHIGTGGGRRRCMATRMRWHSSPLMMTSAGVVTLTRPIS